MTEPATASLASVVAATATATVAFPGIDGNALIGALAGGALFVTSAQELSQTKRWLFLAVSVAAGYYGAPEVVQRQIVASTGAAGFLVGALAVTGMRVVIDRLGSIDFLSLFKRGA